MNPNYNFQLNKANFNLNFMIEEDAPPTLLIRIPSGSASVEPGGELAVFPGSTIHLECLFSRRLGSPDWTWTSPLGQYLTGKVNILFDFLLPLYRFPLLTCVCVCRKATYLKASRSHV